MKLIDFVRLYRFASNQNELNKQLENLPKPKTICDKNTPESLNDIEFGQLVRLQYINTEEEFLTFPCIVLLDIPKEKIYEQEAEIILGFSYWVAHEMERIGKLFKSTSIPPTPEEKQAGIENLNFGAFGLYDWYAQRMGITNHSDIDKVPWVRIYKCLDMDSKKAIYERRLRNILSRKKK